MTELTRLRISILEARAMPALQERLDFPLADFDRHQSALAATQSGTPPVGFAAAWPTDGHNAFWGCLLGGSSYHEFNVARAERNLVPLRVSALPGVHIPDQAPVQPTRVSVEVFAYPAAISAVVTADLVGNWFPEAAAEAAVEVHSLRVGFGEGSDRMPIHALPGTAIGLVSREVGAGASEDPPIRWRISSVISGTDEASRDSPVAEGGDVHRLLHALCAANRQALVRPLPALSSRVVPRHESLEPKLPVELVYQSGTAAAIWLPYSFTTEEPVGRSPAASCYHRNQTMLALHLLAMGAIVRRAAASPGSVWLSDHSMRRTAVNAANVIGRHYGGTEDVYRSGTAVRMVDELGIGSDYTTVLHRDGRKGQLQHGLPTAT